MGRDIGRMPRSNASLEVQSIRQLQDAIAIRTALNAAADEGPQATIMAAVRAIEHVNTWTTGGESHWADFASYYFKKAHARVRIVQYIAYFTKLALDSVPDRTPGARPQHELSEIRSKVNQFKSLRHVFHVRGAVDHVPELKRIYTEHWLVRGLGELEVILATPKGIYDRLEEQSRRFDRHLGRLKRLRSSSIHGGPVSDIACESVAIFAKNLGHQCLNEATRALTADRSIYEHMGDYRQDSIERYQRARTTGDVDALFQPSEYDEIEPDGD